MEIFRSQDEIAMNAIEHALKALRKRHLLEEGAHAPALIALSRPLVSQVPVCVCRSIGRSIDIYIHIYPYLYIYTQYIGASIFLT